MKSWFAGKFRWPPWPPRVVHDPDKVGSIRRIWRGQYPPLARWGVLNKGPPTWIERVWMIALLLRTRTLSLGYWLRRLFITDSWDTQFIELYVALRDIALFAALWVHWGAPIIAVLISYLIMGSFFHPLRIVFVDRYARGDRFYEGWRPYSFNRSFLFLAVHYIEIIIGFAYMYLHFGLVRQSDSTNPITTVWEALYFSLVTITTLGYGDMYPVGLGRFCVFVQTIMGIVMLVLVLGLDRDNY
ncbi:MAG: potassium channel family protein [Planctomycetota bacterium]